MEKEQTSIFDTVLLCGGDNGEIAISELLQALQAETNMNTQQNWSAVGKVDLSPLLIHCAEAVAANDWSYANELLRQIRHHSSPFGSGSERLAHYFADGLEARLAGTGAQIYKALTIERPSAVVILKAYQLFLAACPFKKVSNHFSNQTIMNLTKNATSLHIVDFGIHYGFQWPSLIQRLSARPGGPPKLRITGIDSPQPGSRSADRVEDTGRRLVNYAERFNVPFEYTAIVQKWETIQLEDLKINRGEVLVVNCLYTFKNLLDDTVVWNSPRVAVLQLVRKMNPNVFIHGIVNAACSAPFLITRFRATLVHYTALFDILETIVPRDNPERILIERDFFRQEVLNIIACEGPERIERTETYKQWQNRNLRAGFKQLPLNQEIMKKVRDRTKAFYHKDFVIDEDSQWLLQGWKGHILFALSSWIPVHDS